jgi:hypothetical protein
MQLPATQTVGWRMYKSEITKMRLLKQNSKWKSKHDMGEWIRLDLNFMSVESFLFVLDYRQLKEAQRMLKLHHKLSADVLEIGMISLTHLGPSALPIARTIHETQRISNHEHGVFSAYCALGMTDIVGTLLNDTKFNPNDNQRHFAIVWPCRNGHTEVVKLLLMDGRINPAVERNWPLQAASTNNHPEIVRLLLADSRVDPTAERNAAIHQAQIYGHFEVISILLQDLRVNPFQQSTNIVEKAYINRRFDILNRLLLHPRFQYFYLQDIPDEYLSRFLSNVVNDDSIDPISYAHWSVRYAATKGLLEFLQRLLFKAKISPTILENAMNDARRQNYTSIEKFLQDQIAGTIQWK